MYTHYTWPNVVVPKEKAALHGGRREGEGQQDQADVYRHSYTDTSSSFLD